MFSRVLDCLLVSLALLLAPIVLLTAGAPVAALPRQEPVPEVEPLPWVLIKGRIVQYEQPGWFGPKKFCLDTGMLDMETWANVFCPLMHAQDSIYKDIERHVGVVVIVRGLKVTHGTSDYLLVDSLQLAATER
jgi:hypothetical protein